MGCLATRPELYFGYVPFSELVAIFAKSHPNTGWLREVRIESDTH